jgi:lipid-binding SYLF domain-containing protein
VNRKHVLAGTGLAILALGTSAAVLAANEMQIDHRVSKTLQHFDTINAANVSLGQKAAGMLVFPRVTKGGIGIGGEHGDGALLVGGKTIGYYSVGAASIGLTLGLAKHSEIIMFMTQEALDRFTSGDGWSIGADAGVTVVSGGANGSYETQTQQKPILGFVFGEKGLIGDLSLQGSKNSKIKS